MAKAPKRNAATKAGVKKASTSHNQRSTRPTTRSSSRSYVMRSSKPENTSVPDDTDIAMTESAKTATKPTKSTKKPTTSTILATKAKRSNASPQQSLSQDLSQSKTTKTTKSTKTTKTTNKKDFSQIALQRLEEAGKSVPQKHIEFMSGFMQTLPGNYAEGDRLFGLTTPVVRGIVKESIETWLDNALNSTDLEIALPPKGRGKHPLPVIPDDQLIPLLQHDYNEARAVGVLTLVELYERENDIKQREKYINLFVEHCRYAGNWNIVDVCAYKLVGNWLVNRPNDRQILYTLAHSDDFWEQRVAVVSTMALIKSGQFKEILDFTRYFLDPRQTKANIARASLENNPHNHLLHKAIGWMLREVGKNTRSVLDDLLTKDDFFLHLPTHVYGYCLEKHSEEERAKYKRKKVGGIYVKV